MLGLIKQHCPDSFAELTLPVGRKWRNQIYDEVVANKYNGITEITLSDTEGTLKLIRELKENNYRVQIDVMATSLYESIPSIYERYLEELKNNSIYPRITEGIKAYTGISNTIEAVEESQLADEIKIFTRGDNYIPKMVYFSLNPEQSEYLSAKQALDIERIKDDKIAGLMFDSRCYSAYLRLKNIHNSQRALTRLKEDFINVYEFYNADISKSSIGQFIINNERGVER